MIRNKIQIILLFACLALASLAQAQAQQKTDSVILNVGKSKIIFLIRDHEDLRSMQDYDLNEILDQLSVKLTGDSTLLRANGSAMGDTTVVVDKSKDEQQDNQQEAEDEKKRRYRTHHALNFDIGTNNFLSDGSFPDESNELYTVKPLGSWYIGINSLYKSHIAGPLFLEWGGGISWYNFKFDDPSTRLMDTPDGAVFFESPDTDVDFKKSKLTISYVQLSVVPVIDFGRPHHSTSKPWKDWLGDDHRGRGLRLGVGGYAGYKIDSYTKTVVKDGDRKKKRDHDNFHLENFRYGVRVQLGYRGTDLFFNYDLNELYAADKGPKLNAFSFGLIF